MAEEKNELAKKIIESNRKVKEAYIEQVREDIQRRLKEEQENRAAFNAAKREPSDKKLIEKEEEAWKQVAKDSESDITTFNDLRYFITAMAKDSKKFAEALSYTTERLSTWMGRGIGDLIQSKAIDPLTRKWETRESQIELPDLLYAIDVDENGKLNFEELKAKGGLTPNAAVNVYFQERVKLWLEEKGYVADKANPDKYSHKVSGEPLDKATFDGLRKELHKTLNEELAPNLEETQTTSPGP
ncbi:hypothetical protein E3983_07735 [Legionella israelensis]|uniref:EF-hand domain-containing protein n=1 Tax=Legionella israelensis TaxID=454 RepID=A0AAX1EGT6_9GAMM|nr:hypothetical protein [Legionella israelensis]QBR84262.1 hypothetical protein E3983_07735 [Legionella israelensis]